MLALLTACLFLQFLCMCWIASAKVRVKNVFNSLRMFVLIVSAHPYCACKFTYHVMRERALSNEMNKIGQMAIALALLGFNDLWTFGDPYFSFQKQILFTIISTLSTIIWTKNQCGKFKKKSRFLSAGHRILPCVKLWSLNANLSFKVAHNSNISVISV